MQESCESLTEQLYIQQDLLGFFAKKLSCSDYAKKKSERKDIYAFIHKISIKLNDIASVEFDLTDKVKPCIKRFREQILPQLEPSFTALKSAAEADDAVGDEEVKMEIINERLKQIEERRRGL